MKPSSSMGKASETTTTTDGNIALGKCHHLVTCNMSGKLLLADCYGLLQLIGILTYLTIMLQHVNF